MNDHELLIITDKLSTIEMKRYVILTLLFKGQLWTFA